MSETQGTQEKLSPTQRLENVETGFMSLSTTVSQLINDLLIMKDALKLLNSKVNAIVKATNKGDALTDEVLSKIMMDNEADNLKQRVTDLIDKGLLVSQTVSDANSFYVGHEINDAGEVVNPRLQFGAVIFEKEVQDRLLGAKVGDQIVLADPKVKFVVEEVYGVQMPESPTQAVAPDSPTSDAVVDTAVPSTSVTSEAVAGAQ